MAMTLTTKDEKVYVLLGSTTPVSIIREYCGDDLANWVESKISDLQAEIDSLEDEIDGLESELDAAEAEVAALTCESGN